MTEYKVTYRTGTTRDKFYFVDAETEDEARHDAVCATRCDYTGPAGIQSVEPTQQPATKGTTK